MQGPVEPMQVDVGPEENDNVDAPPRRIVESSNLVISVFVIVYVLNVFLPLIPYVVGISFNLV